MAWEELLTIQHYQHSLHLMTRDKCERLQFCSQLACRRIVHGHNQLIYDRSHWVTDDVTLSVARETVTSHIGHS
jgi:hypothetical protein